MHEVNGLNPDQVPCHLLLKGVGPAEAEARRGLFPF
jgi:hypothetical protein